MDDRKGDFFEIFVYSRKVGKVSKESFYIYLKVVGKIFDIVFLILCNEKKKLSMKTVDKFINLLSLSEKHLLYFFSESNVMF